MSYGTELMTESFIDSEIYYLQVKQTLELLEAELVLRKNGKHLNGFWKTKNGQKIPYSEMTDDHLNNAIRYFQNLVN
jgi:hypothetical protein